MTWESANPNQFSINIHDVVGEELAKLFQLFYMNTMNVKNADWSQNVTPTAINVLGSDKVFSAIVYGTYPKSFSYSGNNDKGCFGSLLPGQYCPAHEGDELSPEIFVAQLQNKVFLTKINAFGRWWWVGAPCTFDVIKPQPFALQSWNITPVTNTKSPVNAGSTVDLNVNVDFTWGTGQRSVAFRVELALVNAAGNTVATDYSKIFIVTRDGDLPAKDSVTLPVTLKLPEIIPPGSYTINTVLYYSLP